MTVQAKLSWASFRATPWRPPAAFVGTCPRRPCRGAPVRGCCGTCTHHAGCDETVKVEYQGMRVPAHWFQFCQCGHSRIACGTERIGHAERVARLGLQGLRRARREARKQPDADLPPASVTAAIAEVFYA